MTTSTTDTAALNERVALACGWTGLCIKEVEWGESESGDRLVGIPPGGHTPVRVPEWDRDLNAMREAESTLTEAQRGAFACRLQHITLNQGLWAAYFASPKHRAEAFLYAKEESLNAQRAGLSEEG